MLFLDFVLFFENVFKIHKNNFVMDKVPKICLDSCYIRVNTSFKTDNFAWQFLKKKKYVSDIMIFSNDSGLKTQGYFAKFFRI